MHDYHENNLHAECEFERLIQPYEESRSNLILSAYKNDLGDKDIIFAWGDILLSSALLYQKIVDSGINVKVTHLDFNNKLEAICFVCMEQLDRNDLTDSYHKYLIGKMYMAEHLIASNDKAISKFQSAMKLAGSLNLSPGTVLKYQEYAKAIDTVDATEPKLADYILNEKVRISHENTIELARIPKDNLKRLLSAIENSGLKRITYSEMRYESHYKPPKGNKPSKVERNEERDVNLAIRQVPVYDPDSQVSSLALTIPSWASSIKRVIDATDFSKISNSARNRLMRSLELLNCSIISITQSIEEEL